MNAYKMQAIRQRLDWPHMSRTDRAMLVALIQCVAREIDDPEQVYDCVHSFLVDAGRAMKIAREGAS